MFFSVQKANCIKIILLLFNLNFNFDVDATNHAR